MKKALFALLLIAASLLAINPAHVSAQDPLYTIKSVLREKNAGTPVEISGIVVDTFFQQLLVLRDHSDFILVRIPDEARAMSLQRGDMISVMGSVYNDRTIRNTINAKKVDVLKRTKEPAPSTKVPNIEAILNVAKDGDVVSAIATVKAIKGRIVTIADDSADIEVDLGEDYTARDFSVDSKVGVVGVRETHLNVKKYIEAISLVEVGRSKVLDVTAEKIENVGEVVGGKKVGEEVLVEGRVAQYIGSEQLFFLFDGVNVLIIRPNKESEGISLRAGQVITAEGTLDKEEQKGKEYAVIKDAVITRK